MTQSLRLKLDSIIKVVNLATHGDVKTGNRERQNVDARQIYFKIVNDHLRIPISHSANYIKKHHATGIHALKQFNNFLPIDRELRRKYSDSLTMLDGYDFEVDQTDKTDLLEDYVLIKKQNMEYREEVEVLKDNMNDLVSKEITKHYDKFKTNTIKLLLQEREIPSDLYRNLQLILHNRRNDLNLIR